MVVCGGGGRSGFVRRQRQGEGQGGGTCPSEEGIGEKGRGGQSHTILCVGSPCSQEALASCVTSCNDRNIVIAI